MEQRTKRYFTATKSKDANVGETPPAPLTSEIQFPVEKERAPSTAKSDTADEQQSDASGSAFSGTEGLAD